MEKIILGKKEENKNYDFRETCFGISVKSNKILVIWDKNQYSLIGGGIEKGETHEDCLRREFAEEIGYSIKNIKPICTIDCFWLAGGQWPLESLTNIYCVDVDEKILNEGESKAEYKNLSEVIDLLPLPYHKKAIEIYLSNN